MGVTTSKILDEYEKILSVAFLSVSAHMSWWIEEIANFSAGLGEIGQKLWKCGIAPSEPPYAISKS